MLLRNDTHEVGLSTLHHQSHPRPRQQILYFNHGYSDAAMSSFPLHVLVPCTCSEGEDSQGVGDSGPACQEVLSSSTQPFTLPSSLFLVSESSATMSLDHQFAWTGYSQESLLGIYVPSLLLASFDFRKNSKSTRCAAVWTIQDESIREQLSSDMLFSIHPFLAEHGKLVGVVSTCREQRPVRPSARGDFP